MNFNKLFRRKSQLKRLCWIFAFFTCIYFKTSAAELTDACRSIHGRIGTCVPLANCPLFNGWLKVRPLIKENLRLLIKYTCYFDTAHPKVCCPNDNLYISQEEEESVAIRLATPVRRGVDSQPHSANKLLFPEPSLSFPHNASPVSGKGHHNTHQVPTRSSSGSDRQNHRDNTPLSFPTERQVHPSTIRHPQNGHGSSLWNSNGSKNLKDTLVAKKDMRHHPNFRLIPKLHECSDARKLDSLLGVYGAYPWIALNGIKRRRSLDFDHVCAGAVINDRYILTVAHCFGRANPKYVRLGEYNLDTLIDQGNEYLPQSIREDYRIEKLTIHPDYNPATGANDIALIRVGKSIALNTTFIKAVCLPFMTEYGIVNRIDANTINNLDGKPAWVAGWSRHSWDGLYSTGSESSILQEGVVEFTSHDRCKQDYPILSSFSSRTQLCVGGKGRRNSCVPDSGGPLMYPIKVPSIVEGFVEPKFFLVGLLSHGPTGSVCQTVSGGDDDDDVEKKEEASRSLPTSVYTRVSKYLSWILDNMQE